MGENCTALLFVNVAAFRIGLQGWNCLYWRNNSMHRFEQRKRHVAVVLSALGKNKHQAVWVEALPLLFCVRCSSFPDRFARLELSVLVK